mgnify:CR=1 FL=1
MDSKNSSLGEKQFKDIEKVSLNGWLGLFIHIIVVPIIFLATFILYALGGLVLLWES